MEIRVTPYLAGKAGELSAPGMLGPSYLSGDALVLRVSLLFTDLQEPDLPVDDDVMLLKCLETFDDEDL